MKRFWSFLLIIALLATLTVTAFASAPEPVIGESESDYDLMVDCVKSGTYAGTVLTHNFFTISDSAYLWQNVKLKFESSGEDIDVLLFILPGQLNIPDTSVLGKISFSDSSAEYVHNNATVLGFGAYYGINILTPSVEEDTTITVTVYNKNSTTTSTEYTNIGQITYELEAAEQVSDEALGMSVECADRSETEAGKQVYAGDTITVSFTGADKFTGTSALFSFNGAFELVSAPGGWTQQDDGGYLYEKSDTTPDDLGEFVLKVMAPSGESGTGTLTLSNRFSSGEPVDTTETLYVIGKPIQYTITGLGEQQCGHSCIRRPAAPH